MVKTLLATGALVVALVAGGVYLTDHSGGGCCLSSLFTSAPAEGDDTGDEGTTLTPTPSCSSQSECTKGDECCAAPSKASLIQAASPAASTSKLTVVSVEGMDCPVCAGELVAKLKALNGVANATADVEKSKLSISAKDRAALSPKLLWETIEKAGYKPTRLESPAGTFTVRPRD